MRTIKFRGLDFDGNWQYGFLMQVDAEGKTYSGFLIAEIKLLFITIQ